ncbi:hypothetical protein DFY75_24495 [Escherichia coli]|nr:hypothetical protein [Escherichia coli]EEY3534615.1 hypothetical protein [Escherichia coli]
MEKKNRPLQAANSDIRVSDVTPLTKSLQAPKRTPKKHRARVYMLRTGIEGWTENDILRYCRLSSGRNYATELERQLGITLERIDEKNPDGIGTHLRYRFSCRGDVLKVITHINHLANINDHNGLSQQEIADILKLYPQWETVGIELLDRCVTKDGLTDVGREIWQSMVNDMGATVAGGSHA